MTETGGAPPQVIRRGDGAFHVLNVSLDGLSSIQRVGLAAEVWPQIRDLLIASGEYRERDKVGRRPAIGKSEDIDRIASAAVGVSPSTVNFLRPRLLENPEVLRRTIAGEYASRNEVARALGMKMKVTLLEGRQSNAKRGDIIGIGDKFEYAVEPILRYGHVWKKKDYRFPHVNSKEAKKRLNKLDQAVEHLLAIRADLEPRSHVATLTAPREKRRRNS